LTGDTGIPAEFVALRSDARRNATSPTALEALIMPESVTIPEHWRT